jgi:hypothetical protein
MRFVLTWCLLFLLAAVGSAQTNIFGPATHFPAGPGPRSLVVADFNGDSKPDLVVTNSSASLSILLGTGTGAFGAPTTVAGGAVEVAAGDFNADGNLDLAVTNGGSQVLIFLGTGTGTFGPPTALAANVRSSWSLAVADFNGDGKLDLALADFGDNVVSILLGLGDGSFSSPTLVRTRIGPNLIFVVAGDFDGDGKPDLAVANHWMPVADEYDVQVLLGTGTGSFTPLPGEAPWVTAGKNPRRMAVGDFNRDGKLDLAVACVSEPALSVLLGTGGGNLGTRTIFQTGGSPWAVAVGDVNGDGNPDLAVTNFNGTPSSVAILLGSGSGAFGPATILTVGNRPTSVALSDLNGDGLLDLAVANEDSNTVTVFLNHGPMATLTVTRQGSGTGTITSSPAGINCGATCAADYTAGTAVTITATVPSGSYFVGWSGAGCTGVDPCVVTMDVDKTVTATFSATAFTFTDEALTPQQTVVKAAHVVELRQAINTLRMNHGIGAFAFTDPTLTVGSALVKAAHIVDLRTALDAVYDAVGRARPAYTDSTIMAGQTTIKRVHILEIRLAVRALE